MGLWDFEILQQIIHIVWDISLTEWAWNVRWEFQQSTRVYDMVTSIVASSRRFDLSVCLCSISWSSRKGAYPKPSSLESLAWGSPEIYQKQMKLSPVQIYVILRNVNNQFQMYYLLQNTHLNSTPILRIFKRNSFPIIHLLPSPVKRVKETF